MQVLPFTLFVFVYHMYIRYQFTFSFVPFLPVYPFFCTFESLKDGCLFRLSQFATHISLYFHISVHNFHKHYISQVIIYVYKNYNFILPGKKNKKLITFEHRFGFKGLKNYPYGTQIFF